MSTFIAVLILEDRCRPGCRICADCCPVNIFKPAEPRSVVLAENEDECTFCDLCLERCPTDAIRIEKLY